MKFNLGKTTPVILGGGHKTQPLTPTGKTEVSNPYTLSNITVNTQVDSELDVAPYVVLLIDPFTVLKDYSGITMGPITVSGSVAVRDLIPDFKSDGDYILRVDFDPNQYYVEEVKFMSVNGGNSLALGTSGNVFQVLIPEFSVDTSINTNPSYSKYIKVNTSQELYVQEETLAYSGWLDEGGFKSESFNLAYIEGHDSRPTSENAVLVKYITALFTTYDPTLDTSQITIDLDLTQ